MIAYSNFLLCGKYYEQGVVNCSCYYACFSFFMVLKNDIKTKPHKLCILERGNKTEYALSMK